MQIAYVSLPGRGVIDRLLAEVVCELEAAGLALAGTVQTNIDRDDRTLCDMDLRLLPDGPEVRISVDRGAEARGCRLDADALERSVMWTEAVLDRAEMLVVNKFGKQEAEGRGLTGTIAKALESDMPVLVGVNGLNLRPFLTFSDHLAKCLPADVDPIVEWCLAACNTRRSVEQDAPRTVAHG